MKSLEGMRRSTEPTQLSLAANNVLLSFLQIKCLNHSFLPVAEPALIYMSCRTRFAEVKIDEVKNVPLPCLYWDKDCGSFGPQSK